MSADPYNPDVRAYFSDPRHAGDVRDGAIGYVDAQGMRIRLSAEVVEGTIIRLRFRAWGCPHLIAACEAVCRQYEGGPVINLERFETAEVMQHLAVPIEKTGRILVLEDTVRSLGQAIRDRNTSTQD